MTTTPLQDWMTRRVAEHLGKEEQEVDRAARFMSLGLDSLTLIGLAGELAELLGRELSANDLWEHESIEALSQYLDPSGEASVPIAEASVAQMSEVQSQSQLADVSRWTPVQALQPHGSKRPLILIHGIAGGVNCYRELAQCMGDDQPVFGLQQSPESPPSVEQMASMLVDALKTIQRKGPYRLGGYCFGGVVAFEMARQLEEKNEACLVELIDAPMSRSVPNFGVGPRAIAACRHVIYGPTFLAREAVMEWPAFHGRLQRRIGRWSHRIRLRAGLTQQPRVEQRALEMFSQPRKIHLHNMTAMRDYRPQAYGGRVVLLQSTEFRFIHSRQLACWRRLASSGLEVRRIRGSHDMLLSPPVVEQVAADLRGRQI